MKNKIVVTKASGATEPFSIRKLRQSLKKSGAGEQVIDAIVSNILPQLYQGISTKKIYANAFRLLRHHSKTNAARFHLKRAMAELGPTGFPFERFMGEVFKNEGYSVQTGQILKGKCVNHEIDVVAKKENVIILMECKYHNQPGIPVDVKTPLYINSRFDDVLDNGLLKNSNLKFEGWLVTNSKFTFDALAYGICKNLKLLSWDYPVKNSLRQIIDKNALYPLTCLTSLTKQEKQWLLAKNFILAKDLLGQSFFLKQAGLNELRINTTLSETEKLLQAK